MHYHFVIVKTFNYKSEFNRVKLFLKLDAGNVTVFIFSVDQSQTKREMWYQILVANYIILTNCHNRFFFFFSNNIRIYVRSGTSYVLISKQNISITITTPNWHLSCLITSTNIHKEPHSTNSLSFYAQITKRTTLILSNAATVFRCLILAQKLIFHGMD